MTNPRAWWRHKLITERISGGLILTRAIINTIRHSGWLAYLLIVVLAAAGFFRVEALTNDIQSSRLKATEEACEQRNDQARKLAGFVAQNAPSLEPRAREAFTVQADCHDYAHRSIDGQQLPDPVPQP